MQGWGNALDGFITMEDRYAYVVLNVYVGYYVMRTAVLQWLTAGGQQYSPVNPVVAGLALVSMRVYRGLGNPYSVGAAWLMAVRLLNKVLLACFHF